MSPDIVREFHREILKAMRAGTVHFPADIGEVPDRVAPLKQPEFVCGGCSVIFKRVGAAQRLCPECAIAADHRRKAVWNAQRMSRRKGAA